MNGLCACGGVLGVYCSRVRGPYRVRYLRCRECGRRPAGNKQVLPIEHAPARHKSPYYP